MRRAFVSVVAALVLLVTAVAIGESSGGAATTPIKRVSIAETKCPAGGISCYKPTPLTVTRGTKVIWTNNSTVIHTVTRCTKPQCGVNGGTGKQTKLASPTIQPKKTYAFTFKLPGTYRYFCKIHGYPVMHGTITVK
jgi:plastocyanin